MTTFTTDQLELLAKARVNLKDKRLEMLAEGQALIPGGDLKVADYRKEFERVTKRPPNLSDDEIILAVMAIEDVDDECVVALMLELEPKAVTGGTVFSWQQLADIADQDDALDGYSEHVIKSAEVKDYAPIEFARFVRHDFSEAQLEWFADPNSDQKKGVDGFGEKIGDNRKASFVWDKNRSNRKGEKVAGTWFTDFVARCRPGRKWQQTVDILNNAKETGGAGVWIDTGVTEETKDGVKPVLKQLSDLDTATRANIRQRYAGRLTGLANTWRKVIAIIRMEDDIHNRMGERVLVRYMYVDPDRPELGLHPTKKPVQICRIDTDKQGVRSISAQMEMSVSDFLSLDVGKAMAAGGKCKDLLDTKGKRGANNGTGQTDDKTQNQSKISVTDYPDVLTQMMWFGHNKDTWAAWEKYRAQVSGENLELLAYNIGQVIVQLQSMYTPEMKALHDKVRDESAKADAAEAEAKVKAAAAAKLAASHNTEVKKTA